MRLPVADAAEASHEVMEECLARVLELEGWDTDTLVMPPQVKARQRRAL